MLLLASKRMFGTVGSHSVSVYWYSTFCFSSAISNPNTSNEAKAEAEKKLYDLEHGPQGKNLGNVAGGLKA
jgi:hypothetical protein